MAKAERAQQAYAATYRALMYQWRDKMKELSSRPLPPRSLPPSKARAEISGQLADMARANAEFVKRMDALQPPAALGEVHVAARSFFHDLAETNEQWAAAIRKGDRKEANQAAERLKQRRRAGLKRMKTAVEKIGGKVPGLDRLLSELDQEAGQ